MPSERDPAHLWFYLAFTALAQPLDMQITSIRQQGKVKPRWFGYIPSAVVESQFELQGVNGKPGNMSDFPLFALLAHFSVSQSIFQLFQIVSRIMHEAGWEREGCGEGRGMPLLSGQALLLGVWPWKRTPFSETSNGSPIGYHYYAVICMHPSVSFPFNNAHGSPCPVSQTGH